MVEGFAAGDWLALAAGGAGEERVAIPGAVRAEGAVEDRRDVDPVARALLAEVAAGGGAVDLAIGGVDPHRGEIVRLGAAAGVDEEAGMGVAGKGEARHAGAGRRGQTDVDRGPVPGIESNRVMAGAGTLIGMGEARLEAPVQRGAVSGRGGLERLGGRQEGEVAVDRAAGAGEVGEAEPLDVRVPVVVAAAAVEVGGGRVGAPLDHAEGRRGPREVVPTAEGVIARLGAGEDVDVIGEAGAE